MDRKTELDREATERGLDAKVRIKSEGATSQFAGASVEQLVTDLVRAFVFKPDAVRLTSSGSDTPGSVTLLTLDVDAEDYGAVVGKAGVKMQALRVITQLLGSKERREYRLLMPERERRAEGYFPMPFVPTRDWNSQPAVSLLRRVLERVLSKPFTIAVIEAGTQTHAEVTPDASERKWVAQLQPFLHTVFHAIGKAQGHEFYVDIQPIAAPK